MRVRAARLGALVAAGVGLSALTVAGCDDRSPTQTTSSRTSSHELSPVESTPASPSGSTTARDPFEPVPVHDVRRRPQRLLIATPAGDVFVPFGGVGDLYRVLHADGSRTPIEQIGVSLDTLIGFPGGFLAYGWRLPHTQRLDRHWLVVDRQGRTRPLPEALGTASPLRPGDMVYRSPLIDRSFAFRPSTGARFAFPVPVGNRLWERDDRGWLWSCPDGGSTGTIWWSSDNARSWHATRYRLEVTAEPSRRWTEFCLVRGGRLALMAFLDDNPIGFVSWPLDGSPELSGALTSFGPLRNVYAAGLLADGRLVFGSNRRGLQVETAPGSGSYRFAPGPIKIESDPDVTPDGLAWLHGRWIYSTADGRHWDRVDTLADQ